MCECVILSFVLVYSNNTIKYLPRRNDRMIPTAIRGRSMVRGLDQPYFIQELVATPTDENAKKSGDIQQQAYQFKLCINGNLKP